jgi:hypothetical protein
VRKARPQAAREKHAAGGSGKVGAIGDIAQRFIITMPQTAHPESQLSAVSNRYFLPARHETASGIAASSGFTPVLGIIDASTRTLIDTLAMGTKRPFGRGGWRVGSGIRALPGGGRGFPEWRVSCHHAPKTFETAAGV